MAHQTSLMNDGNVVEEPTALKNGIEGDSATSKKTNDNRSTVLHRSLHQDPLRVTSAKGNYLELSNGQKIFDATGGAAVACLGHGNEQ